MYSISFVGCHPKSLDRIDRAMVKHLRAILKKPAHISRETNARIWDMAQVARPRQQAMQQLQAHVNKLLHKQATTPDITTTAEGDGLCAEAAGRIPAASSATRA